MLTAHELFGFMPPDLASKILQATHESDRDLYRATLAAVAQARKVRPVFLSRQPRAEQHKSVITTLARPTMDTAAAGLIRGWLLKHQKPLLGQFLDSLGLAHKEGVVDDLPEAMEDAKLASAIDGILATYPPEVVILYLHAFHDMNEARWDNLKKALEQDPRLQFAG